MTQGLITASFPFPLFCEWNCCIHMYLVMSIDLYILQRPKIHVTTACTKNTVRVRVCMCVCMCVQLCVCTCVCVGVCILYIQCMRVYACGCVCLSVYYVLL